MLVMPSLPISFLALTRAVVPLLASRTNFMLDFSPFRGLAERAKNTVFWSFSQLCILNLFLNPLVAQEPQLWCVVDPRVDLANFVSLNLFRWELFRRELVDEMIFLLLEEYLLILSQRCLQILLDHFNSNLSLLLQFFVALLLCLLLNAFQGPDTCVT